jgi:hypothetical protein
MSQHPLVGMWKLVSLERTAADGEVTHAEQPVGFLIYTSEGWFSEAFEHRHLGDGSTSHVLYCGTWESPDAATVIHQPHVHPNADLVGANLERGFAIDGNRFTLTAGTGGGKAELVWERVR